MFRIALIAGLLLALMTAGFGLYRVGVSSGRGACEAAVRAALERQEVALRDAARISREAAVQIRRAEDARATAVQEMLDALPANDRDLCLSNGALRLLNSIGAGDD